jgi:phosphoribosylglycinamide formyltransferase, formyltetrahydrofolate-dependent
MKRVAVFVSGGGTNLQALIDASKAGAMPHAELALVVASKNDAYALERAKAAGIPSTVLRRREFETWDIFDGVMLGLLRAKHIDLVVLAGYMTILGPKVTAAYAGRIVNVHPALIPAFSGEGFYGLRVHEAVLERGCKLTGATVHLVNEVVDGGEILLQKAVEVLPGDTAESLQKRVMEQAEWVLLPQAVEGLCSGAWEPQKGSMS